MRSGGAPSVTSAAPSHPPLRHTRLSVIPAEAGIHAACGGQGHSQCSTAPDHPPVRHSCGGRNPCGLWGVKGTPNARRRPITRLSVIPAEAGIHAACGGSRALPMLDGARSPACPSFLRRQESMRPVGGQGHSQCSTAPDRPPVRHSCLRRNDGAGQELGGRASRRPEATRMTRQTSSAVAWEGDCGFGHGDRDGLAGGPGLGAVQSSFELQTGIEAHAD